MSLKNTPKKGTDKNKNNLSSNRITQQKIDSDSKLIKGKTPKKIFYIILILIPISFFLLLETGLRIFNYGYDFKQWIEIINGKLILNPELAHKYFYVTERVPISDQDIFDAVKKGNSFRIFVLGGSSAAGYPFTPNGSFSRYLKDRLKLVYPHSEIEVINCSMTAVNSYAFRDMMPGILGKKPDLILIYAGHNEYYGALGAGSMESMGSSRAIVNFVISLENYRTFQLVRNSLRSFIKLFSGSQDSPKGTLMARMAEDQYIVLNSDVYRKGLSQFEGNLNDILKMAEDANVPVILGTLTCNLKDLRPFVSVKTKDYPSADEVFNKANNELKKNNFKIADSLFRLAKDLDALRFRAPSQINEIIYKLAQKYNDNVINIDSAFEAASPFNIVGNNLMTDHLHPTLHGYQLMGKLYFEKMKRLNYLPKTKPINLSEKMQDSITVANFNFSKLDSIIADYRIRLLKNDWPFKNRQINQDDNDIIKTKNHIDSIAKDLVDDKIIWEEAHRKAAAFYLKENNINLFLKEMNVLIDQYPIITDYYNYTAQALISIKDYNRANTYLKNGYKIKPTPFTAKWIGTIALYKNKLDSAEYYLKKSLKLDNTDPQVWYNLAGVFVNKKNYNEAKKMISKALEFKPDYPEALNLQRQLQNALK